MYIPLKFIFLFLFLTVSSFAFSQHTLEQKDSTAKRLTPIDGKAIVYILRPGLAGALVKMKIKCDGVDIGSLWAGKYMYTVLDTGLHNFASTA